KSEVIQGMHNDVIQTPISFNRRWKKMDTIGYLAGSLVLATFCMRSMNRLRLGALASNLAFIEYGYLGNRMRVLVLHALLLPVNACRLAQLLRTELPPKHMSDEQRGCAQRPSAEVVQTAT